MKNLYDILKIDKHASEQEIKKSYRELSREYHPDKNPSEDANEIFAEIVGAYEVLSDPEKRRRYDQFGSINDNENVFPFHPFPFQSHTIPPIHIHVELTLEEICNGCQKTLFFDRLVIVDQHNKTVSNRSNICDPCHVCKGTGQILQQIQMGPMVMHAAITCQTCKGQGNILKDSFQIQTKKCKITHRFPKGLFHNQQIVFDDLGNMDINSETCGQIILVIQHVSTHDMKSDMNNHLHWTCFITIFEALVGKHVMFSHPNGKEIELFIEPMKIGDQQTIHHMGLTDKSDLIISFDIHYPELTLEQKEIIKTHFL